MSPFTEKFMDHFGAIEIGEGDFTTLSLFLPCGMPTDIDQDGIRYAIAYTIRKGGERNDEERLVLQFDPYVVWQIAMPERRMYDHFRETWIEQKAQRSGYKIEVRYRLEDISPDLVSPEAIEEARTLVKASKGRAK